MFTFFTHKAKQSEEMPFVLVHSNHFCLAKGFFQVWLTYCRLLSCFWSLSKPFPNRQSRILLNHATSSLSRLCLLHKCGIEIQQILIHRPTGRSLPPQLLAPAVSLHTIILIEKHFCFCI